MLTSSILASLGMGVTLLFLTRRRSLLERAAVLILPAVLTITCLRSLEICLDSPWSHWNAARLAPAIGMLRGIDLYCSPHAGSIQTTLYPPGSYIAFTPAGLAETPTGALLIGNLLTQLYACLAPVLLFILVAGRSPRRAWAVGLGAGFFVLFGTLFQPTSYHLSRIHADGPALFFAVLACCFLFAYRPRRLWCLWAVAACLVLSAWCKQTLVPGLFAIPIYTWWLHGKQIFVRLLGRLMILVVISTVAMLMLFPFEGLFFQTISLPSSFGFKPVSPGTVVRVFLQAGWPTLLALATAVGLRFVPSERGHRRSMRDWARDEPVMLLLVMAACLTPISLLAWAKYGGYYNSFHNLYFLQIASVCTVIGGICGPAATRRGSGSAACATGLILAAAGAAVTVAFPMRETSIDQRLDILNNNAQQQAYEYTLKHPGQAWFPWNPLSNLMAEGRLDPMDRAAADWSQAGLPVTAQRLQESVPPSVMTIAYPPDVMKRHRFVARVFGRIKRPDLASLPGWAIFTLPTPASGVE